MLSHEAREYIIEKIKEDGIVTVEGVANVVDKYYQFDPKRSREREVAAYARRLLASLKDCNGNRTLIAVKGDPGIYIDLDKCSDRYKLRKAVEQLTDKRNGLERDIIKGRRRIAEIEGQLTMNDLVSANGSRVHF
ncbi:MAG: hypothetical protein IJ955_06850 [Oscillospiraceae bacterium]|nr:hypothetical protein [Oscillospiraceae bacterium]